jgi:hypothetical protein
MSVLLWHKSLEGIPVSKILKPACEGFIADIEGGV